MNKRGTKSRTLKQNLNVVIFQKIELKQKVVKEEVYVELVDKTGERKFIKTKLEQ